MKINWVLIWQEFDALASEDEGDWEFHLTHEERKAVERLVNKQLKDLQRKTTRADVDLARSGRLG
mgnify:CR=1 FL=1